MRANRFDRWLVVLVVELREDGALVDVTACLAIAFYLESSRTRAKVRAEGVFTVFTAGVALLTFVDVNTIVGLVQTQTVAACFDRSIRMLILCRNDALVFDYSFGVLVIFQASIRTGQIFTAVRARLFDFDVLAFIDVWIRLEGYDKGEEKSRKRRSFDFILTRRIIFDYFR